MANFEYKGEVNSLSKRQQECIIDILKKQGFNDGVINVEIVGKAGDNYTANVKRINIKDKDGRNFKMIAKIAPIDDIGRIKSGARIVFANESIMYGEVLPKLVNLQIEAGIPEEERFRYAQCYGTLLEEPHELILLEDLQISKFEMLDRFQPLTDKSVRMILKNFAVLHSLSLVLKSRDPETFSTYKTKFIDLFETRKKHLVAYAINVEKNTIEALDKEEYKKAVRNTVSKMGEDFDETYKDRADLTQSVVTQGDSWTNNIMFKLEDNEPTECIMIDYQLSKVSNPVCDIMYMIFNCTDHETRSKLYNDWIQHYHTELDKSLSNFGMNADAVYPRDTLDDDLKKYSKVFFSTAIILSTILIRKPESDAVKSGAAKPGLNEALQSTLQDEESMALFKNKIEGLIDSYRQFGYIE